MHPRASDVDRLSLGTTVYGYAAEDVDAALDARRHRLADQERALSGEQQRSAVGRDSASERDGHVHPHA